MTLVRYCHSRTHPHLAMQVRGLARPLRQTRHNYPRQEAGHRCPENPWFFTIKATSGSSSPTQPKYKGSEINLGLNHSSPPPSRARALRIPTQGFYPQSTNMAPHTILVGRKKKASAAEHLGMDLNSVYFGEQVSNHLRRSHVLVRAYDAGGAYVDASTATVAPRLQDAAADDSQKWNTTYDGQKGASENE